MQNYDSILIVIETFPFDRLTGEHIIPGDMMTHDGGFNSVDAM